MPVTAAIGPTQAENRKIRRSNKGCFGRGDGTLRKASGRLAGFVERLVASGQTILLCRSQANLFASPPAV